MFNSFLKIAWRNLLKDRQFTVLNLLGLSSALACVFLIWLWIADERKVDKYNEKDDRLYQVMINNKSDDGIKTSFSTPGILASTLKEKLPEIESATAVLPASWFPFQGLLSYNESSLKAKGNYVGKDYFDAFSIPFLAGTPEKLKTDKSAIAISQSLARKIFHTTSGIIGKTVKWRQQEMEGDFFITGIFKDIPREASEKFDLLLNYDLVLQKRPGLLEWGNSDPSSFVIVKEGTNITALNQKINTLVNSLRKASGGSYFLTKYSDRYLHGNYENGVQVGGRIAYIRLFSAIGLFILIIACINFMNLCTAKASQRAREVGVRKVIGARRKTLILQYLTESLLMVSASMIFSLVIIYLLLPLFNAITGKELAFHFEPSVILTFILISIVTGLIAGSYPAFYLSGFRPAAVLKGKLKNSLGELFVRKGLVIFQFSLSVIFIAAVLVVYRQTEYIQSKNLGYNRDHLIHFEIPLEMDSAKYSASTAFVKELNNIPGVVNASSYYHNLLGDHGAISGFEWPGKRAGSDIEFANLEVGYNFVETAGINLKQGKGFSQSQRSSEEIIFNEKAIQAMGIKDPIGKKIRFWGQDRTIVGVAADFNFESLYNEIKPAFLQTYPVLPNVLLRIKGGSEKETLARVKTAFDSFNKGVIFDVSYLDEEYRNLYIAESRVAILSRAFAALAIIISCLGLFGLVAFTAQRRKKEIGIRKVLGASTSRVTLLLSSEFLKLVLVAILIAYPIAWWTMNSWLQGFAFRIPLSPSIFILTGLAALGITIITISFQSIKAAISNPVKSLRSE